MSVQAGSPRSTKAVILVGGPSRGTRFRPLSLDVPKPLFEVAGHPIIEHCFRAITKVPEIKEVFIVGYYEETVFREFIKDAAKDFPHITVRYLREYQALGTAGGLYHFRDQILKGRPDRFFVLNADVCCSFPLNEMLRQFEEKGADGLILGTRINKEAATNFGCIVSDAQTKRVLHYVEKPESHISNLINCGVYLFSTDCIFPAVKQAIKRRTERPRLLTYPSMENLKSLNLDDQDDEGDRAEVVRLEQDILSDLADEKKFFVLETRDFWRQIKTAGSAVPANALYLTKAFQNQSEELTPPSATIIPPVYIHPTAQVDQTAKLGPNVSIGPRAVIGKGVRIKESIILEDAIIKHDACILHSIIGWSSKIGAWARVEGSPIPIASHETTIVKNGVRVQNITILGKECGVGDEVHVSSCLVLPHKELKRVKVPVRTNGFVTLDIHHPLISSRNHQPPAVLIHLPPGPSLLRASFSDDADDPRSVPAALAASSSVPVISINYRLDRHHLFPTPTHDVLAGYDWAVRNILQPYVDLRGNNYGPSHGSPAQLDKNETFGRVAVCGELVGGSLALMLALTECRVWDKARVIGANVNEPIVDWIFEADEHMQTMKVAPNETSGKDIEDEHEQDPFSKWQDYYGRSTSKLFNAQSNRSRVSTQKSRQSQGLTQNILSARNLSRLRSSIFPREGPHRYFDPFASPIHFLRSPSMPVPQAHSLEEKFTTLMGLDDLDYDVRGGPQSASAPPASDSGSSSNDAQSLDPVAAPKPFKRSHPKGRPLRFPPASTNQRIPRLQLGVNDNSPLYGQNAEFIKLLRRSIVKYDSDVLKGVSDKFLDDDFTIETQMENKEQHNVAWSRAIKDAEDRASLSIDATGTSSTSAGGRRVQRMGEWFRDVFATAT
ncbi:MAG: Proteasome subunit alpha type-2 [Alyxoria varia]|nr:MAG: Proteasome subunit alpha type-2 [Alyxoria varia]